MRDYFLKAIRWCGLTFLIFTSALIAVADSVDAERYYQRGKSAYTAGNIAEAKELFTKAINEDAKHIDSYLARGYVHQYDRNYQEAVNDFSKAIEIEPTNPDPLFRRAVEYFNLGEFSKCVADFEKFAALQPGQKPHLWQLGIAYYYTGQHKEGRELFESHQIVNSHDVENAVWHFMCIAGLESFEAARKALIGIEGDSRVPMMQIYQLFKGVGDEESVLKAAHEGTALGGFRIQQSFYAHLYLGLYHEAKGDTKKAYTYMRRAAQHYKSNGYMGQVARVHRDWLKKNQSRSINDQ
ncbi:MAG: tetratricopeptide repeat protein [Verrucomicrobia bacterium]|nr:tetratricopeptide repeat protein [Verrucomicrobiota bacterium]